MKRILSFIKKNSENYHKNNMMNKSEKMNETNKMTVNRQIKSINEKDKIKGF